MTTPTPTPDAPAPDRRNATAAQISAAYDAYERACGNRWERITQAIDAALRAERDEAQPVASVPVADVRALLDSLRTGLGDRKQRELDVYLGALQQVSFGLFQIEERIREQSAHPPATSPGSDLIECENCGWSGDASGLTKLPNGSGLCPRCEVSEWAGMRTADAEEATSPGAAGDAEIAKAARELRWAAKRWDLKDCREFVDQLWAAVDGMPVPATAEGDRVRALEHRLSVATVRWFDHLAEDGREDSDLWDEMNEVAAELSKLAALRSARP